MNKISIIHLIKSLDNGGCENFLLRTLPLLNNDFENTVFSLESKGDLLEDYRQKGITVITGNLIDLFIYVQTKRPKVILTYLFHADFIGRLFIPIFFPSLLVIPFLRTTYNHPKYLFARIFEKLTIHWPKVIFANSSAVKDYYVTSYNVPEKNIKVIPNGLNLQLYQKTYPPGTLAKELKLNKTSTFIICVANLVSNKGQSELINAFQSFASNYPDLYLLLVGDGPDRSRLESKIQKKYQTKIKFLGRRKDVPYLLSQSNLFALPTHFEGSSNALMEALVSNLPIVTTAISENLQFAKIDGVALVPVDDVLALRSALLVFLHNRIHINRPQVIDYSIYEVVDLWVRSLKACLVSRIA